MGETRILSPSRTSSSTLAPCPFLAMIMGRLGLMAVLVLFLPRFWRD